MRLGGARTQEARNKPNPKERGACLGNCYGPELSEVTSGGFALPDLDIDESVRVVADLGRIAPHRLRAKRYPIARGVFTQSGNLGR